MAGLALKLASILAIISLTEFASSKTIPTKCQKLEVKIVNESPSKSLKGQRFYYDYGDGYHTGITGGQFGILMTAPEPIRWYYEGFGQELTMEESSKKNDLGCYSMLLERKNGSLMMDTDTGRYIAEYVSNPEMKKSVYLYVPNKYPPFLLNTARLQSTTWTEGKPLVLPCLLNDPTMKVTFSKRSGLNEWKEVQNVGSYDPKVGFTIKKPFGSFTSLFGSYKCFTKLHNRNDTVFISVFPEDPTY